MILKPDYTAWASTSDISAEEYTLLIKEIDPKKIKDTRPCYGRNDSIYRQVNYIDDSYINCLVAAGVHREVIKEITDMLVTIKTWEHGFNGTDHHIFYWLDHSIECDVPGYKNLPSELMKAVKVRLKKINEQRLAEGLSSAVKYYNCFHLGKKLRISEVPFKNVTVCKDDAIEKEEVEKSITSKEKEGYLMTIGALTNLVMVTGGSKFKKGAVPNYSVITEKMLEDFYDEDGNPIRGMAKETVRKRLSAGVDLLKEKKK